ncbi:MAG: glycosyltransferase family 39 protein [Chloroflexota bacterium]|nr:glycosyltransferase family 39 protein [Chloroflexota bacterium]
MTTRFAHYFIYIAIIMLAFALRVHDLSAKELSADEAYGVMMIQQPFMDLWRTGQDLHPPLYHALEWTVARAAGESAFALRFAALIPGVLTVAFAISIGRRVAGWNVGLIAGGLAAASPALVYWSQDARLYTLLATTTAASMDAFLRLNERGRRMTWLYYLLATLAAMVTQYGAFWVIAAQNAVVVLSILAPGHFHTWAQRRWIAWFAGQAVLAVVYLPWVIGQAAFLAAPQNFRVDGTFSVERLIDVARQIVTFWFGGYHPTVQIGYVVGVSLSVAALGTLFLWRRAAGERAAGKPVGRPYVLLVLWIGVTFLIVTLTAQAMDYFDPRFAIAAIVPIFVLIAVVMVTMWRTNDMRLRAMVLLFVTPLIVESIAANRAWYSQPPTAKGDYGAVMARIEAQSQDGDLILFSNPGQIALRFVHAPDALPGVLLDVERVNRTGTEIYLDEVVGDAARVWLVEYGDPAGFDSMRLVPDYLASHGLRALTFDYASGTVALYDLRGVDTDWQAVDARFSDVTQPDAAPPIRLESYRIAVAADVVRLSLLWVADDTPTADYHVGCHILNDAGVLVAQTDALPRGGASRTADWRAGDRIEDGCAIPLPLDLPAGTYRVAVVLYTYPELARAAIIDADGVVVGDMARLTTFAL